MCFLERSRFYAIGQNPWTLCRWKKLLTLSGIEALLPELAR